jgi:hypothetical protein
MDGSATGQSTEADKLTLRPAALSRWAMAVIFPCGILVVAVPVIFLDGITPPYRAAGAALLAAALVLAVRCQRQLVRCDADTVDADTVTVRGALFTWHIPLTAITDVTTSSTRYPAVHWRTTTGQRRRTQLYAFWSGDAALPIIRGHNLDLLDQVAEWIVRHR